MKKIVLTSFEVLCLLSTVFLIGLALNIQTVKASGTIYLRADGSVDPDTAPISSVDNVTYTFTDNINDSIVVERDNIVVDGAGYTLQGTGSGAGIPLSGRSNVTIKNMKITEFNDGIRLEESSNNSIVGNNLTANLVDGLQLINSSSNRIYRNIIANNDDYGILLWAGSNNNSIYENNITDNRFGILLELMSFYNSISGNNIINNDEGIRLEESFYNIISGNNLTENKYGIRLEDSSNNIIYHNNFIDNGLAQADTVDSINNVWDDGYPSGGNYWSYYNGTDAYYGENATGLPSPDGIGDTPYTIDANNTDRYPLMGMFSDFNATSEYHVQTICNSSISDFRFNGTAICFNVSGENGTTGFCRICLPTALINDTYKVFVNGTEVPHTLLPCSNSTHSYLYFSYEHSTQEVVIVPEFPTWTSMLLILFVLTVVITIYKRRLPKTPTH